MFNDREVGCIVFNLSGGIVGCFADSLIQEGGDENIGLLPLFSLLLVFPNRGTLV